MENTPGVVKLYVLVISVAISTTKVSHWAKNFNNTKMTHLISFVSLTVIFCCHFAANDQYLEMCFSCLAIGQKSSVLSSHWLTLKIVHQRICCSARWDMMDESLFGIILKFTTMVGKWVLTIGRCWIKL